MATFSLETGRCGWGCNGGQTPELRLGIVRLYCCKGSVAQVLKDYQGALHSAAVSLRFFSKRRADAAGASGVVCRCGEPRAAALPTDMTPTPSQRGCA